MNKKYIDFVPTKSKAKNSVKKPVSREKVSKVEELKKVEPVREELVVEENEIRVGSDTFSIKKEPAYGVVEDFRPKFVKTF